MAIVYVGTLDSAATDQLNAYRGTAWSETALYLGLLTAGPTASSGTGASELSHADYARKAVTYGVPSGRKITATADVVFTSSATSAWNSGQAIKIFGLWSAATGGTLRYVGPLSPQITVVTGSPVILPASTVSIVAEATSMDI